MSDIKTVKMITRCAQVLFSYAKEKNILNAIYKDLLLFSKTYKVHEAFFKILVTPVIGRTQKYNFLRVLFAENMSKVTFCFFESIIRQHKERLLLKIVQSFFVQYEAFEGIKRARLFTAFPLSSDEITSFKTLVQRITSCKKIILMHHIEPLLIGGYVLEVDDKKLDKSLKSNLNSLKKYFLC